MSEQRTHSRFGGSVADRYMNCAGSVALVATVPVKPAGPYAAEGTVAHELAKQCLIKNLHPAHFLGEPVDPQHPTILVTQEMCDAVVIYLNAVEHEVAQTRTAELFVEQSFTLDIPSAEPGEVHGANDAMVYHPETGRLRVFDYKHGVGLSVDAEDNNQLKFYAAGAVFSHANWRLKEVILTIVQPRARDADMAGAVKDWPMDVLDLLEFQGQLETAIGLAKAYEQGELEGSGPGLDEALKVGSWCDKTFCPAKAAGVCPAVNTHAIEAAGLDFVGVKIASVADVVPTMLPDAARLDGLQLARVVAGLDVLLSWANKCQEYLEAMVLAGHEVPGWKAVEKIGRAKWIDDPQQVVAYAGMMFDLEASQLMPPKIVTITEAEKLLKAAGAKKDDIDSFKLKFTIKESSGLTIAPTSDKRPAANAVATDFASVNLAAIAAE